MPGLLAIDAAAEYLGVSAATLYRMIHRGELPTVRIGGRQLLRPARLDAYIEARELYAGESRPRRRRAA